MTSDESNPLERFLNPRSAEDREAAEKELRGIIRGGCTGFFVHARKYSFTLEDLVQECFLQLLRGRATNYDPSRDCTPYLRRLSRNTFFDLRKKERECTTFEEAMHSGCRQTSSDPDQHIITDDIVETLIRQHRISDQEETILRMRSDGVTEEDIGDAIGRSKQRVSELYRDVLLRLGRQMHAESLVGLAPKHLVRTQLVARQIGNFITALQLECIADKLPQLPRPRREETRYICNQLGKQGIKHLLSLCTDDPEIVADGGVPRLIGRLAMMQKERCPYPEFLDDISCASDAFRVYLGGASSVVTNPDCLALMHDLAGFLALSDPNSVVLQCIHQSSCFESSIQEILYGYYLPYYEAFWSGENFNTWLLNYWVDKAKRGCFDRSPYLAATQARLLTFLHEKTMALR